MSTLSRSYVRKLTFPLCELSCVEWCVRHEYSKGISLVWATESGSLVAGPRAEADQTCGSGGSAMFYADVAQAYHCKGSVENSYLNLCFNQRAEPMAQLFMNRLPPINDSILKASFLKIQSTTSSLSAFSERALQPRTAARSKSVHRQPDPGWSQYRISSGHQLSHTTPAPE